jgi:chorismate dehydratase
LKKIKLGAVSYLNTKPLLYGIENSGELREQIELTKDYPSKIASQLLEGRIDAGLVPVAIIPKMKEYFIVSDFCIGANGDVASVCLFSDVELDSVQKILLDYQSETSSALCKVLLKHHWKKNIVTENSKEGSKPDIGGTTAGVLIGDRALQQRQISKYIYDLAGNWKQMTGLPFVFAAWIANKKLPEDFVRLFNNRSAEGVNDIEAVLKTTNCSYYDLRKYYTENISFRLDAEKIKGMNLFLNMSQQL